MKSLITISALIMLATPNLIAATESGDWKYEKVSKDSKEYCIASTKTEAEDLNAVLSLNIPISESEVPTVSVTTDSLNISDLKIKALVGKTDKSNSEDLTLLALAPNIENQEQVLQLPIWKAENLTDDLISDNSLDMELINEAGPSQELSFSLKGSSKVIRSMVKDCLLINTFNRPRVLSKVLTESQNSLIDTLNEVQVPVATSKISLDEFYVESAALNKAVQSALLEKQSLQVITAESDEAQAILDQITSDLGQKQELNSSLADEKSQIIREKRSLPIEKNQLLRQVEVDQVDVPVLRSEYKSAERKYTAAKALSRELTEQMEELENDIQFYENELNRVQVVIEDNEDQADVKSGQLNKTRRDLDRLINNSDIGLKQRKLDELLSELSGAQSRLDNFRPRQKIKKRLSNNNEYQAARRDSRQLSTEFEGLKADISNIRKSIRNKRNQAQAKQDRANQASNALNTAKSQKPVLEQKKRDNLDVAHRITADRKAAHELRQVKTAERKTACDAGDRNLCRKLGQEVQQLKRKVDGLDRKAQVNINQRQKMESKIAQYENDINTLGPKITKLQNQATRLSNEANQLDRQRSQLKNKMESVGVRLNDAERTKNRIKDRVSNKVWARNSELVDEVNRLSSRSSRLSSQIDNINRDISDLRFSARKLRQQLDSLDAEVADLKSDEANIIEDLSSKTAQRDDLANSSDYRTARQKTQRAKSNYEEAKSTFIIADSRLNNSLERLSEIENKMEDNIERLPVIEEELVIVASDIERLKSEEESQSEVAQELNQERVQAEDGFTKVVDTILSKESLLTNNI